LKVFAFLGPDGVGKSSVVAKVIEGLRAGGSEVEVFHTRPQLGRRKGRPAVINPHGKELRSRFLSVVQAVYWLVDLWLWFVSARVREALGFRSRGRITLFDRFVHDLVVDPQRARFGAGRRIGDWAVRAAPRPTRIFLLLAPVSVIRTRKVEVAEEETRRQLTEYGRLANDFPQCVVVDTSPPVEKVAEEILELVQAH
jgi:thymidylate kinase